MMEMTSETILRIIWAIFFVYWFYSARKIKKVRSSEPSWTRILHLTAMVTNWVLLMAGERLPEFLRIPMLPESLSTDIAGVLIAFAGLCFAIWSRITLGSNWSGAVTLKQDHEIIRSGPYRWVRHPIYTGIITTVLGSAIATHEIRGLIAFFIVVIAYLIKIPREEKLLTEHFPKEYPSYLATTRKLIPFLY